MDLNIVWFILIAVLYIGFFVLEGFDFGVGILLPFLGKNDTERRAIINTIGPHWDANEVWLITAGGATFAAFPQWYATLFSGFYLPLLLLLAALIIRGLSIEFRNQDKNPKWRNLWDWGTFLGGILPALLIGVAFTNIIRGVPIDEKMQYTGGFFNLLNPYALLGGITTLVTFTLHGAIYLSMKTTGKLRESAQSAARKLWITAMMVVVLFTIATYLFTDFETRLGVDPGVIPVSAIVTLLLSGFFLSKGHEGWAFAMTSLGIVFAMITFFVVLFPRVMVSSTGDAFSLTIYNASSSPYTLQVMSIVALIFVPIALAYQAWSYWVFRKRIESKPETLTY